MPLRWILLALLLGRVTDCAVAAPADAPFDDPIEAALRPSIWSGEYGNPFCIEPTPPEPTVRTVATWGKPVELPRLAQRPQDVVWQDSMPGVAPDYAAECYLPSYDCGFQSPYARAYRGDTLRRCMVDLCCDYREFYAPRTMALLLVGLGGAAILANTPLDEDFQHWHDRQIQGRSSDIFADAFRWFGEGKIMIPVFAGTALLGPACDSWCPECAVLGEWGVRCARGVLVGGPTLLALKYLTGASRPEDGPGSSRWRPLHDSKGASGHAFIGALPFLNAAMMCDDPGWRIILYTLSTFTAWSRINDDKHYLSQAFLGWWVAYLAAEAVDRTQTKRQNFMLLPHVAEDEVGVQMVYRW